MTLINLSVLGCAIRIECMDKEAEALLGGIYSSFKQPTKCAQITYQISRERSGGRLSIIRGLEAPQIARDRADFIYRFDTDLTVQAQQLRADLYFVHGAVLALDGYAIALVAPSGYGKSTTAWGLLHHGLDYLSDELGPIDIPTMRVHPFPRALCLKENPPSEYPVPAKTISTARTIHVPASSLPGNIIRETLPLKTIFFLRFIGESAAPVVKPISKLDATVSFFTNALNPLAHAADGFDAAAEIISKTRSFQLFTADLRTTCELIKSVLRSDFSKASGTALDALAP